MVDDMVCGRGASTSSTETEGVRFWVAEADWEVLLLLLLELPQTFSRQQGQIELSLSHWSTQLLHKGGKRGRAV